MKPLNHEANIYTAGHEFAGATGVLLIFFCVIPCLFSLKLIKEARVARARHLLKINMHSPLIFSLLMKKIINNDLPSENVLLLNFEPFLPLAEQRGSQLELQEAGGRSLTRSPTLQKRPRDIHF